MSHWRLLDTGHRSAAENCTLDQVLLQARNKGERQSTIRFLQFRPPCCLIGFHQTVDQEIRLDYCQQRGIEVNRRITGGGAIYFSESCLGWEVIASKQEDNLPRRLEDLYAKICRGVIRGLRCLGLSADFRPRNDIEVNGRKIAGTGGTENDHALLFQGTLLMTFDAEEMVRSLRIPVKKLTPRSLAEFRNRVTSLEEELGDIPPVQLVKKKLAYGLAKELRIEPNKGKLSDFEQKLFWDLLPQFRSESWIFSVEHSQLLRKHLFGIHRARGGTIRVGLAIDPTRARIQQAIFTGDFFPRTKRTVFDLEARLKNVSYQEGALRRILKETIPEGEILGIDPADFEKAIQNALEKMNCMAYFGFDIDEANSLFLVNTTVAELVQNGIDTLLLPYCAKSLECGYRYSENCNFCGKCSVGVALELGKSLSMRTFTILNFEHLQEVLGRLQKENCCGYIGCCCEAFFLKHVEDFMQSKVPGILIDISSKTCYDLGEEVKAYLGKFERQTTLNIRVLSTLVSCLSQPHPWTKTSSLKLLRDNIQKI
ncbi:MAG: DUF116 domain-containing protein [Candidatus Heimdallarchaeota archaeon]